MLTRLAMPSTVKKSLMLGSLAAVAMMAAILVFPDAVEAKKEASLNDKVHQLLDLSAKRSVIRLNGNKFRDYVRNAPRNYR